MQNRCFRRLPRGLSTLAAVLCLTAAAFASEPATKKFDVPADQAPAAIKMFSQQARVEVLFPTDAVAGVRTHAAKGDMTPKAALETMVAGTGFVVVQDEKTGALGLRQETTGKNGQSRPAASQTAETGQSKVENGMLRLEDVHVLGSRIRQTEREGPSPVSTYGQEYIRASGAMTLADFLNSLPQTYSGIAAGRGSAPNELNPEFGQRTENSFPSINFVLGASDAPPGQTGVSGVSLRGLGSGSTLVLVDGRRAAQAGNGNRSTTSQQGFVDLNTIPLGMIDHIEVTTDGASAIYGADAVAGVINIVLKKNWTGSELSGSYRASQHGGGRERNLALTSGFAAGKLRGTVSVDYYDRAALKASDRSFSKNQNHTGIIASYDASGNPIYGRDLRLLWGYPGVVQARTGTLNGIIDPNGNPTRFAIINPGLTGTPTLASFTGAFPGQTNGASYIVRGNTARFLDIIPESERYGVSGNFTYRLNDRIEVYGGYTFADSRGFYETQPGVSSAATSSGFGNFATIVPAAYNPFGQDIVVGLIDYEFGSVWQRTHSMAHRGNLGARGRVGQTWEWDTNFGLQYQTFSQLTRNFNGAGITAALSNPDPAQRLNPFIDARVAGITQAAIYETMAIYPTLDSASRLNTVDFSANGDLFPIWGGPVKMAWGGSYERATNDSTALNYSSGFFGLVTSTSAVSGARDSEAAFAEISLPVVGRPNARPLIHQLDLTLAGRYENHGEFSTSVPKYGISWVPFQALLFRASYSEGFRAPGLTEYEVASSSNTTNSLTDPRRTPASTTGVLLTSGANPVVKPETSRNEFYGVIIEPPFANGLNFQVNYYRTTQQNVIQQLSAQTIINNEALFANRITRAAPTVADQALNQPGQITAVDQTLINFGQVINESIDFTAEYLLPWKQLGRWHVNVSATHTLKSTRELAPGAPPLVDDGDTFAPPAWKWNSAIFWTGGSWSGSVFVSHLGGFGTNKAGNSLTFTYPVPATTKVDANLGYEFKNGVWRHYGKGLRVNVGVDNVFDKKPPFSDTVFGYNGGLHGQYALGRAVQISFVQPF